MHIVVTAVRGAGLSSGLAAAMSHRPIRAPRDEAAHAHGGLMGQCALDCHNFGQSNVSTFSVARPAIMSSETFI